MSYNFHQRSAKLQVRKLHVQICPLSGFVPHPSIATIWGGGMLWP